MNLLVFGRNGRTGRQIIDRAIEAGHRVTGFVGDVRDAHAVHDAVAGHDVVISAIGHRDRRKVAGIYSTAARNYVDAMRAHGVARLIALSAFVGDAAPRTGFLFRTVIRPLVMEPVFCDLERAEEIYRRSPLEWTAVRPSRLTDGPATGNYRVGVGLKGNLFSKIARADVADFVVGEVQKAAWKRACPELLVSGRSASA
jgi:putative NADH-flavin reductase